MIDRFGLLLVVLGFCVAVASCGGGSKYEELVFPETGEAEMSYVTGEDEILPNAFKMEVADSMIVMAGPLDNRWIHVYHRDNGRPLAHYLPNGSGPDEVIASFEFRQNPTGTEVFDLATGQVKCFNNDWHCVSSLAPDLSKDSLVVKKLHFLQDGRTLFEINTDLSHSRQGFTIMRDGCRGNVYLDSPVDDEPEDNACMLDRHCVAFSPDGLKFASATLEGFILETFGIDNLDIKKRSVRMFYPYESVERDGFIGYSDRNVKGVVSMTGSDRYIVASFNGTVDGMAPTDITVWDWEGNPIRRYALDVIVLAMGLSPDNPDVIYALVQRRNEETRIAKITCPGLLD